MLRVGADHAYHALAMDDLAVVTHFLNGCPNLHMTFTLSAVHRRPADS